MAARLDVWVNEEVDCSTGWHTEERGQGERQWLTKPASLVVVMNHEAISWRTPDSVKPDAAEALGPRSRQLGCSVAVVSASRQPSPLKDRADIWLALDEGDYLVNGRTGNRLVRVLRHRDQCFPDVIVSITSSILRQSGTEA